MDFSQFLKGFASDYDGMVEELKASHDRTIADIASLLADQSRLDKILEDAIFLYQKDTENRKVSMSVERLRMWAIKTLQDKLKDNSDG